MNKETLIKEARSITECKAKMTDSFKRFTYDTLGYRPDKLTYIILWLFNAWLPQTNLKNLIYVPNFYLTVRRLYMNILIHEMLHVVYPFLTEEEIVIVTNQEIHAWLISQKSRSRKS
jgi:hypothetical protein